MERSSIPQHRRSSVIAYRRTSGFLSCDSLNNEVDVGDSATFFERHNQVFDAPSVNPAAPRLDQMRRLSLTIDELIFDDEEEQNPQGLGLSDLNKIQDIPTATDQMFDFPWESYAEPKEQHQEQQHRGRQEQEPNYLPTYPHPCISREAGGFVKPLQNEPDLDKFAVSFRNQLQRLITCMKKSRKTRDQVALVKHSMKQFKHKQVAKVHSRRVASAKHQMRNV